MKVRLKSSSGKYLSFDGASDTVPLRGGVTIPGVKEEFWLYVNDPPRFGRVDATIVSVLGINNSSTRLDSEGFRGINEPSGGIITTVDSRGRVSNRVYMRSERAERGDTIIISRTDGERGSVLNNGDRVTIRFSEAASPGFLYSESGGVVGISSTERPDIYFTIETVSDLKLFWSDQRSDNFSTATLTGSLDAQNAGYRFIRSQGRVYMNPGPGLKPLYLLWHDGRGDNLLTASKEGIIDAVEEGYRKIRIEGYIHHKPQVGTIPLRTYWNVTRNDSFTATIAKEERDASDAQYTFVREEGYLLTPSLVAVATPVGPDTPTPVRPGISIRPGTIIHDTAIIRPGTIKPNPTDLIRINLPRRRRDPNKKALVLSGGGAKGCFEAGAVQHLWNNGYRPNIICGVSVGALNAAKLGENQASSANELVSIWEQLNPAVSGGGLIYSKDYFTDLVLNWIKQMPNDAIDDLFGGTNVANWITYVAAHLHSIHSMHPLRNLIDRNLNITALANSGVKLRIGITDVETGQYFSVTEPFPAELSSFGLAHCGRIELEPDHRIGENWLTRPIFGADAYAMSLKDAIYASSTLPVFMDPKILNLRHTQTIPYRQELIALLKSSRNSFETSTYSPPSIERLMNITRGERNWNYDRFKHSQLPSYDLNQIIRESFDKLKGDARSEQHHLFDGGLRDTMAIRTAIRLGAREITVITGDRLQTNHWQFKNPGSIADDMMALPVAQYLFSLLGIWFNEAARTDVLLSVAQNEFLGWLYRCYSLLTEDRRRQIVTEFNEYWASHGATLRDVLGGSTWLGGDIAQTYGTPFQDEGCSIRYIAPSGELVDALGFDKWNEIQEGIHLGFEAAQNPIDLSSPVPESLVG
jgi:predicted acylesterase/phospholipase RssA